MVLVSVDVCRYESFFKTVAERFENFCGTCAEKLVWLPGGTSSFALFSLLPDKNRVLDKLSPISLLKAVKNPVELKGMQEAQVQNICEIYK